MDAWLRLRSVVRSSVVIVRQLVAGVLSPRHGGGVEGPEPDDQKGDDDEDAHGAAPFDVLTGLNGLIGY